MTSHAVIAIGSNIGPRENIPRAIAAIASRHRILNQSPVVPTEPVGPPGQPPFINTAVLVETDLDQDALRQCLRGIEDALGRTRPADKYAPRTIDLDIVVWNGRIIDDDVRRRPYLAAAVGRLCPELGL